MEAQPPRQWSDDVAVGERGHQTRWPGKRFSSSFFISNFLLLILVLKFSKLLKMLRLPVPLCDSSSENDYSRRRSIDQTQKIKDHRNRACTVDINCRSSMIYSGRNRVFAILLWCCVVAVLMCYSSSSTKLITAALKAVKDF